MDTPDTSVIVGNEELPAATAKALQDAGEDARTLVRESAVIAQLLEVEIIARHLWMLVHESLQAELTQRWDVQNPTLVLQTLTRSMQHRAATQPATPVDIRQGVFNTVIPVLDIYCRMQEEDSNETPETVHRNEDGKAD